MNAQRPAGSLQSRQKGELKMIDDTTVTYEVGYEVAPGIFSVNMIWANTDGYEEEAIRDTAQRHAARHGYRIAYMARRNGPEIEERLLKGMPFHMIDDEAEKQYDRSFRETAKEA